MRQLKITPSITSRTTLSTEKYLQEVSKEKMITPAEEIELTKRIKQGDKSATDKLVRANLRFVVSVAKQYQNRGMELGDIINEGNLGLIKAAGRFDETRGFKFISFAVWWIRQSISEALANQGRIVRIPLNKIALANKYQASYVKLEQELGRVPDEIEILEHLKSDRDDVQKVVVGMSKHFSLNAVISDDDNTTFMDKMEDKDTNSTDSSLISESLSRDINRMLDKLEAGKKGREAMVLRMCYGIGQNRPLSLEEIGQKLDLTRERVRQIKEKALRNLRIKQKQFSLNEYL